MKKKDTGLIVFVVIVILLIVGFVIYYEVQKKKNEGGKGSIELYFTNSTSHGVGITTSSGGKYAIEPHDSKHVYADPKSTVDVFVFLSYFPVKYHKYSMNVTQSMSIDITDNGLSA